MKKFLLLSFFVIFAGVFAQQGGKEVYVDKVNDFIHLLFLLEP